MDEKLYRKNTEGRAKSNTELDEVSAENMNLSLYGNQMENRRKGKRADF